MRRLWALLVVLLLAGTAGAHELSMAELQVRELGRGEFILQWGAGEKSQPADSLRPVWPEHCRVQDNLLRCGEQGLKGSLGMQGVGDRFSAALVRIYWQDGGSRVYTLTAGQPMVQLYGAADDQRGMGEVAAAYITLGVEHILSGFDHLLFVLGLLSVQGVGQRYSAAVVKVHWRDGGSTVHTLTAGQPTARLYGASQDTRGLLDVARAYTVLGIEHILGGYDHLLFVLGLLFLVGFSRRLVWTITAFTVAHSLTLASAALGWLTLRSPPVEACIALSIVLVASEALQQRQTLARRLPALVAFLFGLVHGLGFAGALQAIGLPQQHLLPALLTFNLGVELGQLLTVAAAWVLLQGLRRVDWALRLRLPALYTIGSLAAYWSWLRIAAMVA